MNHQPASPDNGLRVAFVTMHTSPLERPAPRTQAA